MTTTSRRFAGVRDTWARLGRIDLTSKPVIISLIVAHVATVFGFELGRVGQEPFLTLSIALMAEVLFWATYLTLYALQIWLLRDRNSVFLKVFIIIFSNTVRTFSLEFALFQFDLMDQLRIADRFLGDSTGILMLLIGIAYIQVVVSDLAAQERVLSSAKAQLNADAQASKLSAEGADRTLRATAQETLGAQLASISKYLKSAKAPDAKRLTGEIQDLIDNRVRPLSVELWKQLAVVEDPAMGKAGPTKTRWPRRIFPASDFRPNVVIALSGLNIFITAPGLADWQLAWLFLPWILLFPLIGALVNAFIPKRMSFPTWIGVAVVTALTVVAYSPALVFLILQSSTYPGLTVLSFTSTNLIAITSVTVAIWSSFKRERLDYLDEIQILNAERARQLALIDQAVWVARRNWTYLVHGTVQGALTVAISRVRLANEITPELITQILQDVERAKSALTQSQSYSKSWAEVWPQIEQTWEGVCKVKHTVTPEAEALLNSSSATSTCVAEISKELVSNAFRHGKASEVSILISTDTPQDLRVVSTNNGLSVDTDQLHGIGSEMFDELTTEWSWKNTSKGPRFTATVPVATNP
jgi:signal transduction histidine kinase